MVDLASLLAGEQKRKTFAQMLAQQSAETTPTPSWGAGLARALQGGMAGLIERGEKNASGSEFDKLYGGTSPAPATTYSPQAMGAALQPSSPPSASSDAVAEVKKSPWFGSDSNGPSPFDPPSGQDRTKMIATILGESGNQSPTGQTAVASVIRNRVANGGYGGDTPSGVVTAPNQFEPWNTAGGRSKMNAMAADPDQADAADLAIAAAYGEGGQAPNDPTNGATMFYAPKAQAALGRDAPSWAKGSSQDIGDHRFYGGAPQEPGQQPYQAAGPPPAAPQPGQPQPMGAPQRTAPQIPPDIQARARDLWVNGDKAAAAAMLQPYTTPKDQFRSLTDPAERARLGIPEADKNAYQVGSDNKVMAVNPQPYAVNINNQAESEFSKEAAKHQAKRFDELAAEAPAAKQMLSDVATLRDLGGKIGTGKGAQVMAALGPYAEMAGIKIDHLDEAQAYKAIVNKIAPSLRVKGSGAQSDRELANFLESLPSLGNTPNGNEIISRTLEGLSGNKLKASEIGANALNGVITRAEADKQLRELPDPMKEWREVNKGISKAKEDAGGGQVIDGYTIKRIK